MKGNTLLQCIVAFSPSKDHLDKICKRTTCQWTELVSESCVNLRSGIKRGETVRTFDINKKGYWMRLLSSPNSGYSFPRADGVSVRSKITTLSPLLNPHCPNTPLHLQSPRSNFYLALRTHTSRTNHEMCFIIT